MLGRRTFIARRSRHHEAGAVVLVVEVSSQGIPTGRSVSVEITVVDETVNGVIYGVRTLGEANDILRAFELELKDLRQAFGEATDALRMYADIVDQGGKPIRRAA